MRGGRGRWTKGGGGRDGDICNSINNINFLKRLRELGVPKLCKFTMTQRRHFVKYCRLKKNIKYPSFLLMANFSLSSQVQPGIYSLSQRSHRLKMFCMKNEALVTMGPASPTRPLFPSSQRVVAGPEPQQNLGAGEKYQMQAPLQTYCISK